MRKIYASQTSAEAHLLVEMLQQEGIEARVQDHAAGVVPGENASVWIDDPRDEERALALVESFSRPTPKERVPKRVSQAKAFERGFFLGLTVGFAATWIITNQLSIQKAQSPTEPFTEWDANGDGVIDSWAEYDAEGVVLNTSYDRDHDGQADRWEEYDANGRIVRARTDNDSDGEADLWQEYGEDARISKSHGDSNLDGAPDFWEEYDERGLLIAARYDEDSDGTPDLWQTFQDEGKVVEYAADNDGDGRRDEWGTMRHGQLVVRRWSFSNDKTIDKRAFYKHGRRTREEYDRDRDGVFEEVVRLDAFERPLVRSEAK